MKKTSFLFAIAIGGLVIGYLFLAGCQKTRQSKGSGNEIRKGKGLTIEIKNGKGFPKELAGTWRCAENKWEIMIEKNGTVSWVLNPLGGVWMEPGKTLEEPRQMDTVSIYAAGPWKAMYDHKTSVFSIDIVIPYFEIAVGKNDRIKGDSKNIFTGPMDSKKGIWEAEWISSATYIVDTEVIKDHQLDTDDDPNNGTVIFKQFDVKY